MLAEEGRGEGEQGGRERGREGWREGGEGGREGGRERGEGGRKRGKRRSEKIGESKFTKEEGKGPSVQKHTCTCTVHHSMCMDMHTT